MHLDTSLGNLWKNLLYFRITEFRVAGLKTFSRMLSFSVSPSVAQCQFLFFSGFAEFQKNVQKKDKKW